MSLMRKLRVAATDPVKTGYFAWSKLSPGSLYDTYRRKARAVKLNRLYLTLSFDCDTAEDAAAAWEVHVRLRDMGVTGAYAVPGAFLEEASSIYGRIAATGAIFINHGYRKHTYFDEQAGGYRSSFFYDQEPRDLVADDIRRGHEAVKAVIGAAPLGFRAPHFGTFQKPSELDFQYRLLSELGYAFSTTTMPLLGLRFGPAFRRRGIWEFPLSGGSSRPLTLINSWGCFRAPDRVLGPDDYRRETVGMARRLSTGPGLLNFYVDPSHVVDQPIFFAAIAEILKVAEPVTYPQLLARLA